jgi:hypothetical protein
VAVLPLDFGNAAPTAGGGQEAMGSGGDARGSLEEEKGVKKRSGGDDVVAQL